MKATLKSLDARRLGLLLSTFEGDVSEFILSNSDATFQDVGCYYSPNIERGTRSFASCHDRNVYDVPLLRIEFPSSTLHVIGSTIIVEGFRGSIEDCLVPILLAADIDLDDSRWVVEKTLRPDVPWYRRAI